MCPEQKFAIQLFLLLILGQQKNATKYKFIPENGEVFSECPNQPSNVLGVKGLYDFTHITITQNIDSITIAGNATNIWDVSSTDRLQFHTELLRYDRGSWLATALAINVKDFCKILFDKGQYWYMYWTQHIINVDQLGGKCPLNTPGSIIIHKPFDVDMNFECASIVPMSGRYKIQLIMKAFDQNNVERKTKICVDIIAEIIRAK